MAEAAYAAGPALLVVLGGPALTLRKQKKTNKQKKQRIGKK